jgi:hypothetical protein
MPRILCRIKKDIDLRVDDGKVMREAAPPLEKFLIKSMRCDSKLKCQEKRPAVILGTAGDWGAAIRDRAKPTSHRFFRTSAYRTVGTL